MHRKRNKKQPIYCGQYIKDWEGYRIEQVQSNDLDRNVRIKLVNDSGHVVKIFLDDLCLDGESMCYTEWQTGHGITDKKEACSNTPTH